MEKVCLELENIELSYLDQLVLDIPRLAVHQFDRIGIVGKNGAGKSTLLKLMDGRIAPDKGHVYRLADFGYYDQLDSPVEKEVDYELVGKLSIPQTEIENLSGGEQTRLKLAGIFSTIMKVY
jgi:macrolide transport system ATP-binding/permease protein